MDSKSAREHIERSVEVKLAFLAEGGDKLVERAAEIILQSLRGGGRLFLFGNGGSAADAQHIAGELVGRFEMEREALPVLALTTDTSILTAVGNDYGFDNVFERQVEAFVKSGDVVIAISTSGNSKNVVAAARKARESGAKVIGLTGGDGGELKTVADLCIVVPAAETCRIQECHITIGHALCSLIERGMFGSDSAD